MREDRTLLGERVRIARLQRGWSKEYASRVAGISSITWKRVEDGLGVQDHKRWAVLTALGLDDRGYPTPAATEDRLTEFFREQQPQPSQLDENPETGGASA